MRALPVRQCVLIGVFVLTALAAVAQQPNADDLIWQKAVAKYDSQRAALLKTVDQEAHEGPFQPNWDSLKNYKIPDWYQDAKFGIFIHWGLYSVPAFGNEWYPRNMYVQGSPEFKHHVETYGPQTKFGYKDFIPMFHAEHFDPAAWAALFKESGAKYVIPVAEHHDGFPMYDTGLSDWSAAKMGPKRDLIGDLANGDSRGGAAFRGFVASGRALLVPRRRKDVSVGCAGSEICGVLWSGAHSAGGQEPWR